MSSTGQTASVPGLERRLPPIIEVGVVAMALCIVGVIYLTSYVPRTPALGPAIGLVVAAAAVVLVNAVVLARIPSFNWSVFRVVFGWTLAAYAVIAGMLMYTFIYDSLPTGQLTLLVATLAVFAIDIPMMLAFSVARFQPTAPRTPG
jgi:ABC-type tungstate transport system substrate-binding protein